jgi:hypothetical protein
MDTINKSMIAGRSKKAASWSGSESEFYSLRVSAEHDEKE